MEEKSIAENNKKLVVLQLLDMFGKLVTSDIVLDVCGKNNWQIESCIENLIECIESTQDINITSTHGTHLANELFQSSKLNTRSSMVDIKSREISAISESELCRKILAQSKNLGAIPKSTSNGTKSYDSSLRPISTNSAHYSHVSKAGFQKFDTDSNQQNALIKEEIENSQHVKSIIKVIEIGYRIMIIMRGAPGSGKSYLARSILDQTIGSDYRNYIFSSDDYFYNINEQYVYKREKIQEAHDYNQKRVRKKAAEGWSPIIVDNTNIKIWEMSPYVQIAVQHGYILEILQPNNYWSHSASALSIKNKHGVSKEKIEKMLRNFEPVSTRELIKINHLKYSVQIPLLRHYPPFDNFQTNSNVTNKTKSEILEETDLQTTFENKEQNENSFRDIGNTRLLNSNFFEKSSSSEYEQLNEHATLVILKSLNPESKIVEKSNTTKIDNINSADVQADCDGKLKSYVEEFEKFDIVNTQNIPKPARNSPRIYHAYDTTSSSEILDNDLPGMKDRDWKSNEEENSEFQAIKQYSTANTDQEPKKFDVISGLSKPKRDSKIITEESMKLNTVLENEAKDSISTNLTEEYTNLSSNKLERHKLGCPNESKSFLMLRQIYENIQLDSLWDLFEKCNGDVNWAIDILLKDDSCIDQRISSSINVKDYFICCCDDSQNKLLNHNQHKESSPPGKVPRYKTKKEKLDLLSPEMLEAKRAIEKQIILAEEYYTNNIKKIRNFRHEANINDLSVLNAHVATANLFQQDVRGVQKCEDKNNYEILSDAEIEDVIEINLGEELIRQLESTFNTYSSPKYSFSDFKTNVFMPKSLAKQVYALWIESLYNQLEEKKQKAVKEDEELARFLQNSEDCTKYLNAQRNFKNMDMDLAWSLYKSEIRTWKNSTPKDLASYLTRLKLYDLFPNIDKDTLLEILIAHENRFSDTVNVLKDSLKGNIDEAVQLKEIRLLHQAKDADAKDMMEVKLRSEEAKKLALTNFEESRNLAVHHSQLKAECYRKAKEVIQTGHRAVAVYYSQIANLHKNKVEKCNQKAASCIMELQNLNQSNPDLIDLHYLHVTEAVECLDVFLDRHITKLRKISRSYKFVFIITGRGLHSTGGISAIKNKAKLRLKERSLTWSEVNPGLLKVKIFSSSKYSKNV